MHLQLQFTVWFNATRAKFPLCCLCQQMCCVCTSQFFSICITVSVRRLSQASWNLLYHRILPLSIHTIWEEHLSLIPAEYPISLMGLLKTAPRSTKKREGAKKIQRQLFNQSCPHKSSTWCWISGKGRKRDRTLWVRHRLRERGQTREEKKGITIYCHQSLVVAQKQKVK